MRKLHTATVAAAARVDHSPSRMKIDGLWGTWRCWRKKRKKAPAARGGDPSTGQVKTDVMNQVQLLMWLVMDSIKFMKISAIS